MLAADVVRPVLTAGACSYILTHNHPSAIPRRVPRTGRDMDHQGSSPKSSPGTPKQVTVGLQPKLQPKQVAPAVTGRHQALVPTPQPLTAQQKSALADIGRHDPYPFEGLVPARTWGFKSPLRHNSYLRGESFDDAVVPSTANSGGAAGETHASSSTAEWGSAYRRLRALIGCRRGRRYVRPEPLQGPSESKLGCVSGSVPERAICAHVSGGGRGGVRPVRSGVVDRSAGGTRQCGRRSIRSPGRSDPVRD